MCLLTQFTMYEFNKDMFTLLQPTLIHSCKSSFVMHLLNYPAFNKGITEGSIGEISYSSKFSKKWGNIIISHICRKQLSDSHLHQTGIKPRSICTLYNTGAQMGKNHLMTCPSPTKIARSRHHWVVRSRLGS